MFTFDMDRSTTTQAVAVGVGGNVVLLLAPLVIWSAFGAGSAVAKGMLVSCAYLIGSNALIEWPVIADTIRRGSGAEAWHAYLPNRDKRLRASVPAGIVADIAVLLLG